MNLNAMRRKRIFVRVCAVLLFVTALVFLFLFMKSCEEEQSKFKLTVDPNTGRQVMELDGKKYILRTDIESFLAIGVDKFENQNEKGEQAFYNDELSDFLMLVVMDRSTGKSTAVQINRDTLTDVPRLDIMGQEMGTRREQIAFSHTYGDGGKASCLNTVKAVSNLLLKTPIEHYASVKMDAVPIMNDRVGGVEVTIDEDFSSVDLSLVKGETVRLNGEQALEYVRSRKGVGDETNISRMERQRNYISALYESVKKAAEEDDGFVMDSLNELSGYTVSDCGITKLSSISETIMNGFDGIIHTIDGESKKGETYMEFIPDSDSLRDLVVSLFYEPAK